MPFAMAGTCDQFANVFAEAISRVSESAKRSNAKILAFKLCADFAAALALAPTISKPDKSSLFLWVVGIADGF